MRAKHYILLFISIIPILIFRDFTPDNELRYLSIANENLKLGRFFAFLHHGEIYADKPPLYIWLVMTLKKVIGTHSMFFLSLLSVLPALAIIRLMDLWTHQILPEKYRLAAGVTLFTSVFFIGSAVVLRMDMLMVLFIMLSLRVFYQSCAFQMSHVKSQWLFGLFVFLALFTKGPMGILIPIMSVVIFLVLERKWKQIPKFLSWRVWLVLFSMSSVWFFFVWVEGGNEYLNNLLFHQTVDRAVDSFHHKKPFYYYFVSYWYALAPWSLFLILCWFVRRQSKSSNLPIERLFTVAFGFTFIFLSLVSSKIVIYLLPSFPFFVYLMFIKFKQSVSSNWLKIGLAIPYLLFGMVGVAAIYVCFSDVHIPIITKSMLWLIIPLVLGGCLALYYLLRKNQLLLSIHIAASGLLMTIFVAGLNLTKFNKYIGYGEMSAIGLEEGKKSGADHFYTYKVRRPQNMDVYLGQPVEEIGIEALKDGYIRKGILFVNAKKAKDDLEFLKLVERKKRINVGDFDVIVF